MLKVLLVCIKNDVLMQIQWCMLPSVLSQFPPDTCGSYRPLTDDHDSRNEESALQLSHKPKHSWHVNIQQGTYNLYIELLKETVTASLPVVQ